MFKFYKIYFQPVPVRYLQVADKLAPIASVSTSGIDLLEFTNLAQPGEEKMSSLCFNPFPDLNAISYFSVNLPNDWIYL